MRQLSDVPTEILSSILEYVYLNDLQTLITSQRTSTHFRAIAQDILSRQHTPPLAAETGVLGHFLRRRFRPLWTATDCFTREERDRTVYLTIAGDNTLPFKRLPWAGDARLRAAYLRPEASWRGLSVAQPGHDPVTHLEVIRSYMTEEGDTVQYSRVVLPGGFLTMGSYYDILLDEGVHFGGETGEWELELGKRLKNHGLLTAYECFIRVDEDLVFTGPEARCCAILYVQGAVTCEVSELRPAEHDWEPAMLGKSLKFLSWDESKKTDFQ